MIVVKALILFLFLNAAKSQYQGCDFDQTIPSVGRSITVKFSGNNAAQNCRFKVSSPVSSIIEASCSFSVPETQSCNSRRLLISRSGDDELRDANYFCGRSSTVQRSIGNSIVVALRRANKFDGSSFACVLKSSALTNSNCDCGWNVRSKIVGGTSAGVNEFVSHAGLVDKTTKEIFCGAIIVTQTHAITAAHCFDAYPNIASTALLAGDHDISKGSDSIWAAAYILQSYTKHRQYNPQTNANDIATIRVRDYIKFNRGVGPACLPFTFMQNDAYFFGKYLTVVGWGSTEFAGASSNILKKANVQVIDTQTCQRSNQFVDNSKVCSKESMSGSSCSKDSGGGLYWSAGRKYAIGIVSYGTHCSSNIPSVNTRITSYMGWIESNVSGFLCRKT